MKPTDVPREARAEARCEWPAHASIGAVRWPQPLRRALRAWRGGRSAPPPRQPSRVIVLEQLFEQLSLRLPRAVILCCDAQIAQAALACGLELRSGMLAALPGGRAGAARSALSRAAAAKLAHPERPVVAIVDEDSLQARGMGALIAVARAWRRWPDARCVVIVLDPRRGLAGGTVPDPCAGESRQARDRPGGTYAEYARLMGLAGLHVSAPEAIGVALDQAIDGGRPALVELAVDAASLPAIEPRPVPAPRPMAADANASSAGRELADPTIDAPGSAGASPLEWLGTFFTSDGPGPDRSRAR